MNFLGKFPTKLLTIIVFSLMVILAIVTTKGTIKAPEQLPNSPALPESNFATYTSDLYHFTFTYPKALAPKAGFDTFHLLSKTWRVDLIGSDTTGVPIVSVPVYRTSSDNSYPRYFGAELRIGASRDAHDVASCLVATNGLTEDGEVVINGVTFKKFSFQDAAMMQYVAAESYRTIHAGTCFAVEQVKVGSSYRDDPTSSKDIPDSVLNEKFASIEQMIKSFTFTN